MPIEPVPNNDPFALSESEILECFNATPVGDGRGGYLVAVGRAIELKARAKLPKLDLLRAAQYLACDGDSMSGAEADRVALVLRELAA